MQFFENKSWDDLVEQLIIQYGFTKLKLPDAAKYGLSDVDSWKRLFAQLCKRESNFNPKTTYAEGGHLEGQLSTGLFQMSYGPVRSYSKFAPVDKNDPMRSYLKQDMAKATTEDLKDPIFNIRCMFVIANRWLVADKVIARKDGSQWKGLARYWSPFRKADFAPQVLARKPIASEPAIPTPIVEGPEEVSLALAKRAELAKAGVKGGKCNYIFEVDYSIPSYKPRLFVYSIRDKKLYRYKAAHGIGGSNRTPNDGKTREVSNVSGSLMSSLGYIVTGPKYTSDSVGVAVRLNGLSPTNSKILARGVVLHGGAYVSDNEKNTDTSIPGRSWGCIVVDDKYISRQSGGELIEWLKDGSVGVAHYAGKFKI